MVRKLWGVSLWMNTVNELLGGSTDTCAHRQETELWVWVKIYRTESKLTGKDVWVSVLLLVVVLVCLLIRPLGVTPRQRLQSNITVRLFRLLTEQSIVTAVREALFVGTSSASTGRLFSVGRTSTSSVWADKPSE